MSEPITTKGSYTITTSRDGAEDVCELILVDSTNSSDCIDGVCQTTLRPIGSSTCGWSNQFIGDDAGSLSELYLAYDNFGPPAEFDIRIERDGALVGETSDTLEHTTTEPNGEGCGERHISQTQLTVMSP